MAITCFKLGFTDPFQKSHHVRLESPETGGESAMDSFTRLDADITKMLSEGQLTEDMATTLKKEMQKLKDDDSEFSEADARRMDVIVNSARERKVLQDSLSGDDTFAPIFLRGPDNTRILPEEADGQFKEKSTYRVDFYEGWSRTFGKQAEQAYGLHHFLPKDVNQVSVKVKKTGATVVAVKGPDGIFLDSKEKRAFVYDQDEITVLKRGTLKVRDASVKAPAAATAPRESAIAKEARLKAEAAARKQEALNNYGLERANALDAALGKIEGDIDALSEKPTVYFSPETRGLKADDYGRLSSMHGGEQVKTAVRELSTVGKKEDPTVLFGKLVDGNEVSFREICKSVYGPFSGVNPVMRKYEKLQEENKVIQFAAPIVNEEVQKILDPTAVSDYPYAAELRTELAEGKTDHFISFRSYVNGKVNIAMDNSGEFKDEKYDDIRHKYINGLMPPAFRDPTYMKEGADGVENLENNIKELETLLRASYQLMEAVPMLELAGEEGTVEKLETPKSEDVVLLEQVTADLFPPSDAGPTIQRAWLARLFTPKKSGPTVTMDTLDEGAWAKETDAMGRYVSNASAYRQMRYEMTRMENGQEVTDLTAYCEELKDLRLKGWAKAASNNTVQGEAPSTPITVTEGPDGTRTITLTAEDKEYIRLGMAMKQTETYIQQKQAVETYETARKAEMLSRYPKDMQVLLVSVDQVVDISPEELDAIGARLQEIDLGVAGLIYQQETTTDYRKKPENPDVTVEQILGGGYGKRFDLLKTAGGTELYLDLEAHGNVLQHKVGVSAGAGFKQEVSDRTTLGGEAYASVGGNERGLIPVVGGVITLDVDLGKYKTTTLNLEAGAGFAAGLLFFSQGIGVTRNIENVLGKKSAELGAERKEEMEKGVDSYMRNHPEVFNRLTPEQAAEFKDGLLRHYERDLRDQAVEDLSWFQFVGCGVKVIEVPTPTGVPLVFVVPWLRVGIQGKDNETIHYARPKDMPELDEVEEAKFAQELAKDTGLPDSRVFRVYTSGRLELSQKGEKTLTESQSGEINPKDRTDLINTNLAPQGVELEPVGDGLRMKVSRVDGVVNLYVDPASGVETYIKDGYVYLNISKSDQFVVNRVDFFSPFATSDGYTHEVSLYITDNRYNAPQTIELSTKDVVRWEQSDTKKTQEKARYVTRTTAERGGRMGYESEQDMLEADVEKGDILDEADIRARLEARRIMWQELGSSKETPADYDTLSPFADTVLKEMKIDYIRLTDDQKYYEEVIQGVQKIAERDLGRKMNNHELTVVMQLLHVRSRATMKESPEARIQHILNWNKRALANSLVAEGVEYGKAKAIAEKIVNYYAAQIRAAEEGNLPHSWMENEGVVQTLMGPNSTGRFGELLNDSPELSIGFYGSEDVTYANLTGKFKLTPEEANLFLAANEAQMAPLNTEKPYEFMQTELGMAVLEHADLIWGAERTLQLAALRKQRPQSINDIRGETNLVAWADYAALVLKIRQNGSFTKDIPGGKLTITSSLQRHMGFLANCQNYTTTWKEGVGSVIALNQDQGVSIQYQDYVEGLENTNITKLGFAATASLTEKEKPHKERAVPTSEGESDQTQGEEGDLPGNHIGEIVPELGGEGRDDAGHF